VNTSTTLKVGYAYATGASNHVRRTQTVYPNGRILHSGCDGMNQLVALQRGRLNSARDALRDSTRTFGESWSLDMTGNWRGYDQDADGNGTPDLAQTRTHNVVNEITAITGGSWATPAHDRAGNMTTIPSPRPQGGRGAGGEGTSLACTYDAWNRLVKVVDAGTSNTVAEYGYDGRNFRIVKKTYASGVLSEVRHAYYSGDWQLLEERVEAAPLPNPQSLIPAAQFVWGLRYIDTPVLRDENTDSDGLCDDGRCYYLHDANMNVVALTSTAGAVVERYAYDAYGQTTIYDGAWSATRSVSSYSNAITYTGRQYDPETGFLYFRQRYLTAPLGRFLSRDPIGYKADAICLSQFVQNRPMSVVDPLGLQTVSVVPELAPFAAPAEIPLLKPSLSPSTSPSPVSPVAAGSGVLAGILVFFTVALWPTEFGDEEPRDEEPRLPRFPTDTEWPDRCKNTKWANYDRCDSSSYPYRSFEAAKKGAWPERKVYSAGHGSAHKRTCGEGGGEHWNMRCGGKFVGTILCCLCCDMHTGKPRYQCNAQ